MLPWPALGEVQVGERLVVFPKGQSSPWCDLDNTEVPNKHVFLALVDHGRQRDPHGNA
jgi:hypothetical protein